MISKNAQQGYGLALIELVRNRAVTWILEYLIEIVADEIKKCGFLSVAYSSGLAFVTVDEVVQKKQDAIDGYLVK